MSQERDLSHHFSESELDAKGFEQLRELIGPTQIDQQVRQAISFCWMGLKGEQRSADELERQIRRIVDRALRDFRDDLAAFGG